MTKKALKALREAVDVCNKKWRELGHEMSAYTCNHCDKEIPTRRPDESMVTSKGFWDSCPTCTNCGECNFVKVFPNGSTQSSPL